MALKEGERYRCPDPKCGSDPQGAKIRTRYWHYAVEARPLTYPCLAYAIRAHVLFSSDGTHIWASKDRLHRARRSACRDWWNDDWRDRMLAAMTWLAAGNETVRIELGSDVAIDVGISPLRFESVVSYLEPKRDVEAESAEEDEEGADQDDWGEPNDEKVSP